MSEALVPRFNIEKIYVKDLSLEIPHAPQVFLDREAPEIEVQVQSVGNNLDEGLFEVVLTVTVTARLGEKTMFLVEAGQAGIFEVRNVPQEDIEPILSVACPNIIFPYVRETVSDIVNRAGFPPILLSPVNFEAIYQQRLAGQEAQPAAEVPVQ